jgi:hypothetical protein
MKLIQEDYKKPYQKPPGFVQLINMLPYGVEI